MMFSTPRNRKGVSAGRAPNAIRQAPPVTEDRMSYREVYEPSKLVQPGGYDPRKQFNVPQTPVVKQRFIGKRENASFEAPETYQWKNPETGAWETDPYAL